MCRYPDLIRLAGAASALLLAPAIAWGQDQGLQIEVVPKLGAVAPLTELGAADLLQDPSASKPLVVLQRAQPVLATAVSVGVRTRRSAWGARASFLYATPSPIRGSRDCAPSNPDLRTIVICTSELIPVEGEISMFAAVGDVVYRPVGLDLPVAPYAMLGLGIRRYHVEYSGIRWNHVEYELVNRTVTRTDPALHLGLGAEAGGRRIRFTLEVEDYISRFGLEQVGRETKHDLAVMMGWRIGLP